MAEERFQNDAEAGFTPVHSPMSVFVVLAVPLSPLSAHCAQAFSLYPAMVFCRVSAFADCTLKFL